MALGGAILGIIALFFPPLPVFIRRGCGLDILINIGLLFLGWIPGVLHAWYIILTYPSFRQRRRAKQERRRSMSVRSASPHDEGVVCNRRRSMSPYEHPVGRNHEMGSVYSEPKRMRSRRRSRSHGAYRMRDRESVGPYYTEDLGRRKY